MPVLTLQPGAAGIDTHIQDSANADTNFGGATTLADIGKQTAVIGRGLLKFDLSTLPAAAIVSAATLTLVATAVRSSINTSTIDLHPALYAWFESLSTWNNLDGSVPTAWTGGAGGVAGTEYQTTPSASTSVTNTGTYTWDVTADVIAWHAGSPPNHGWWIINRQQANTNTGKTFASSDNATAGNRPKLEITYTIRARSFAVMVG